MTQSITTGPITRPNCSPSEQIIVVEADTYNLEVSNTSSVIVIDNSTLTIVDGQVLNNCLTNVNQVITAQLVTLECVVSTEASAGFPKVIAA